MRSDGMVLTLGFLLAAFNVGAAEPQDELKKLQGTWVLTSMKCTGLDDDPERLKGLCMFLIEGESLVIKSVSDGVVSQNQAATLKLDPSAKIKTMDWTILEATIGPLTSKTNPAVQSIYELKNDVLKVCWTSAPGKRPVSFDLKQKHDVMVITLARKK